MTTTSDRTSGIAGSFLVNAGRFFTPGKVSDDLRTVTREGGRDADSFYRDRWSHDKIVRSTHGVNCTGSCSWKVYVKDGVITWETQQTDYPSVGADSPEYEPRGCPRGAAFSWYTYSPTRVRYPYIRGVLLEAYRAAKREHPDPVDAWKAVVSDPETRQRYHKARGKGGLVRASWDEAKEIVAAAHVHTIKEHGPDRVFGFSPIPAMSMASHAAGGRFISMLGGSMLSFYDWYADLPVASPAGVRRPDRRARIRRLVERLVPHHVGRERARDAHSGRPLHGGGALSRPEGRHRLPRLRRQHQVRRRVDEPPPRHGRRSGDGHGSRGAQGVLHRAPGAAVRGVRQEVQRPAVPGEPQGKARRVGARQVRHRRGPWRYQRERSVQDRADRLCHGSAPRPQRLAGPPLWRRGHRQVEP